MYTFFGETEAKKKKTYKNFMCNNHIFNFINVYIIADVKLTGMTCISFNNTNLAWQYWKKQPMNAKNYALHDLLRDVKLKSNQLYTRDVILNAEEPFSFTVQFHSH